MSRSLLVQLLFVVVSVPAADAQTVTPEPSVVVAQGEAILRRAPDRAWITIATEVREGKAADARQKSAEAMAAVHAALKSAGLPADALRTTNYSLVPEMGYGYTGNPGVRRYVVRSQIEVRIDDLARLADVIDAANTAKNVALTISSPRLELANREKVELEAARAAVQSAMARAEAMAAGAGRALGSIVRIQQGAVATILPPAAPQPTPRVSMEARRGGGNAAATPPAPIETPIAPGELEVRAQATVTVAIR